MKLKVDKDLCIACQATAPDVFELKDDGLAECISNEINEEIMEDAMDAKDGCPTDAIKEVEE